MQGRTLQRTPEWVDTKRESAQAVNEGAYAPFCQLSFHDPYEDRTLRRAFDQNPKKKIKTRGVEILEAPVDPPVHSFEDQTDLHFALNHRALKVFRTLFFIPSATSTPGEIAWADFLYAMTAVGFAPEHLYGSVWHFSPDPSKLAVDRSIQFHQPHGNLTKIPYRTARRHGNRLNRAYGWHGSTFTLKEKSGS